MNEYDIITGGYKKQFIEDILEGMTGFLDNKQLAELNKSLYHNTANLDFADNPANHDLNYEKTNKILIEEFIKAKKTEGKSKATIRFYKGNLKKFNEWAIKSFLEITSEDIKDYLIFYQQLNNCSKVTVNNTRRVLSSFFRFLSDEEKILINPILRVPAIKEPKRMKKAFTYSELEKMRTYLNNRLYSDDSHKETNYRNLAIFELFLSSGIRVGELVNIKTSDIDFDNNKVTVLGKGNKERITYFSERAKQLIKSYLKYREMESEMRGYPMSEYLFTSMVTKRKLRINSIETMIRKLGENAGINKCHCHKFRRTFCTNLVKKGMAIDQVQKLMGHESIEITLRYLEMDDETIQMTHQKYTNF